MLTVMTVEKSAKLTGICVLTGASLRFTLTRPDGLPPSAAESKRHRFIRPPQIAVKVGNL